MTTNVKPSVAQFRAMFPAFSDAAKYSDAVLQARLNSACCIVSGQSFGSCGDCRLRAIYLCAAHLGALAENTAAGGAAGFTTAASAGGVSVTIAAAPYKNNLQYWLSLTPYGLELLALLKSYASVGMYCGGEFERVFR